MKKECKFSHRKNPSCGGKLLKEKRINFRGTLLPQTYICQAHYESEQRVMANVGKIMSKFI